MNKCKYCKKEISDDKFVCTECEEIAQQEEDMEDTYNSVLRSRY